jgi:hypothetical protein
VPRPRPKTLIVHGGAEGPDALQIAIKALMVVIDLGAAVARSHGTQFRPTTIDASLVPDQKQSPYRPARRRGDRRPPSNRLAKGHRFGNDDRGPEACGSDFGVWISDFCLLSSVF